MQSKDAGEAQEAQRKLDDIMGDPAKRDALAKKLDEMIDQAKKDGKDNSDKLKDLRNQLAKKDGKEPGKQTDNTAKHDGKTSAENTEEKAPPGSLADLKNRAKAGELILEQFKNNTSNEELKKRLGWTDAQLKDYQAKLAKRMAALNQQIEAVEKNELPFPREKGPSVLTKGPERVKLEPKDGGAANAGGKFVAPPGFTESYRRFTDEVSGNQTPGAKR